MPNGIVTHLEARLLKNMVNREIHTIRCAQNCKQMFMKGLRIGELCAETGHFWWALKVWRFTANLIEEKDYNDWRYVQFNTRLVRLRDVISETECELLMQRCSDLLRTLGFTKHAWWDEKMEYYASNYFGTYYDDLFAEKYEELADESLRQIHAQEAFCYRYG